MTLNCIWWWDSSPGALENVEYLFIAVLQAPLWPGVVVRIRVPSMGQIELFYRLSRIIMISHFKPYSYMQIIPKVWNTW